MTDTRQNSGSGFVFPSGDMKIPGIDTNFQFGRSTEIKTPPDRSSDSGGVRFDPALQMPSGVNIEQGKV